MRILNTHQKDLPFKSNYIIQFKQFDLLRNIVTKVRGSELIFRIILAKETLIKLIFNTADNVNNVLIIYKNYLFAQ